MTWAKMAAAPPCTATPKWLEQNSSPADRYDDDDDDDDDDDGQMLFFVFLFRDAAGTMTVRPMHSMRLPSKQSLTKEPPSVEGGALPKTPLPRGRLPLLKREPYQRTKAYEPLMIKCQVPHSGALTRSMPSWLAAQAPNALTPRANLLGLT